MRRALSRLADQHFDLLIIGGGITGCCIARDAALRGLSVALVEKRDFASATSAFNTKLIHGGLRYLKNMEFGLVRESLRARRIWQRIAPHLVHPLPFLVPMLNATLLEHLTLSVGLTLYDLLSYERGWLSDPYQRLPGHSWISRRDVAAGEPVLDVDGLSGGLVYYDAQMYSPERLALECLIDADANGAAIANHLEAESLVLRDSVVSGCVARDAFSEERFEIRSRQTVVATGPWADIFLENALNKPAARKLKRSKGIHVVVPARTQRYALTVAADNSHFFIIPWRGHTLIGTTDTPFSSSPDVVGVAEDDIVELFSLINRHLPSMALSPDEVEYAYAGLRPLVDDGSADTYGTSRRAEIVDHANDDGIEGLISVIGGKWTTSRDLAELATNLIVGKAGGKFRRCSTTERRLPGGMIDDYLAFERDVVAHYPEMENAAHLGRLYGARLTSLMAMTDEDDALKRSIGKSGDRAVQVVHAIREEMAMTLEDVVLRRTGIGQLGMPDRGVLEEVASMAARELAWSDARCQSELSALMRHYRFKPSQL